MYIKLFQHFKGKYYLSLFRLTHGDTHEKCVVYMPLYGKLRLFVRTIPNFHAFLNIRDVHDPTKNYSGNRFTEISLHTLLRRVFTNGQV